MPSFISYMGGKHSMSKKLIPLFPNHKRYVEVFMGSATVFFTKPRAQINILNDKNSNLVNLFNMLKDNYKYLYNWVKCTPISRELYDNYVELLKSNDIQDRVQRAGMYMYLIRLSYNCQIESGWSMAGFSRYVAWSNNWKETLKWFSDFLDNVVIENMDFERLIKTYDSNDTFMYLDPPYYLADKTKYYEIVFNQTDHLRLFNVLKDTKCNWLVSYDNNDYIKQIYKDFNIQTISNPLPSGSKANYQQYKNEIIISNYQFPKQQYSLF